MFHLTLVWGVLLTWHSGVKHESVCVMGAHCHDLTLSKDLKEQLELIIHRWGKQLYRALLASGGGGTLGTLIGPPALFSLRGWWGGWLDVRALCVSALSLFGCLWLWAVHVGGWLFLLVCWKLSLASPYWWTTPKTRGRASQVLHEALLVFLLLF